MTVPSALPASDARSRLVEIVGEERVREATPAEAVDGMRPSLVVEPMTTDQVSAVLTLAHAKGLAVLPRGAGTKMDLGNPPSRADILLSMAGMNRLLDHAAGDLVARVQGGASLSGVQSALARERQRLALDPPERDGSIGGTVAANASGPLRLRYGTMRDLLIGLTYVLPNGVVARAGGRVVKNVAGYDLCKLFTGSLGTLGVITEAIVRLHPVPETQASVRCRARETNPEGLYRLAANLLGTSLVPSALTFRLDPEHAGWSACAVFEGVQAGVQAQVFAATAVMERYGPVETIAEPDLHEPAPTREPNLTHLVISSTFTDLPMVHTALASATRRRRDISPPVITGSLSPGVTRAAVDGEPEEIAELVHDLRHELSPGGAWVTVRRAPPEVKRLVDVWGPMGDAASLMHSVKQRFDPRQTLNPGRFVEGL